MVDHTRRGTQRRKPGPRGNDYDYDDATSRESGDSSWSNEACCALLPERKMLKYYVYAMLLLLLLRLSAVFSNIT